MAVGDHLRDDEYLGDDRASAQVARGPGHGLAPISEARADAVFSHEMKDTSPRFRDPGMAPRSDWTEMESADHFVQFYEEDAALVDALGGYIGAGLLAGDAGIVIATEEHRAAVAAHLRDQGLDVTALRASGQYVPLDAAELLSTFMIGGFPDRQRVFEIIGAVIREAAHDGRSVRIFGEMVALLWADGNYAGALRLEELWNELGTIYPFVLFCAYPTSGFGTEAGGERLRDVCMTHVHVVPAESYSGLPGTDERLRAIVELQQKASLLETEIRIRKQIEQDLRASEAALSRSLQLRDEFLSAISHDLKTPVTVLLGQAQLLQRRSVRGTLGEEGLRQGLDHIAARSRMLAELVDELQDVTRLRIGEDLPLDRRPMDLAALAQEVVGGLDEDATAHRIVVRADDAPLVGWWDRVRLRRVVENLLGNAIKYSPEESEVVVTVTTELAPRGAYAVLTVQDHGIGIADDDLPHIFELFYRGKNGVETVDGMGIGLAGSRHIVEQHGGTIAAESQEGAGSVFTVRLPLAMSAVPARQI